MRLGGLADHHVSDGLERGHHGAQLDLLIGPRGEPVPEETTRHESEGLVSKVLSAINVSSREGISRTRCQQA